MGSGKQVKIAPNAMWDDDGDEVDDMFDMNVDVIGLDEGSISLGISRWDPDGQGGYEFAEYVNPPMTVISLSSGVCPESDDDACDAASGAQSQVPCSASACTYRYNCMGVCVELSSGCHHPHGDEYCACYSGLGAGCTPWPDLGVRIKGFLECMWETKYAFPQSKCIVNVMYNGPES